MRLLKITLMDRGEGEHEYLEESSTMKIRDSGGYIVAEDAILKGVGMNIGKFKHHIPVAECRDKRKEIT